MKKIQRLVVGAALITALAGAGTASSASSSPVPRGEVVSALLDIPAATTCAAGNASAMTAMIQAKPGSTCGCDKVCPFENPPATCGPDEKVVKQKVDCNYQIICDGVVINCTTKEKVETCVPKKGPTTDA